MNLPGVFLPILLTTTILVPAFLRYFPSDSAFEVAQLNLVVQDYMPQATSKDQDDCGDNPCPK